MMDIFRELWAFMRVRKKWWLGPILVTMMLLSALIVLTQGSAVAAPAASGGTLRASRIEGPNRRPTADASAIAAAAAANRA